MKPSIHNNMLAVMIVGTLFFIAPHGAAHAASSAQCKLDALSCAVDVTGFSAACAADAIVDGATTVECIAAWTAAGQSCTAAAGSCPKIKNVNNITRPTTNSMGNIFYYNGNETFTCSDENRVTEVIYRASPAGLSALRIICSDGETYRYGADGTTDLIYGRQAEQMTCDTGEFVTGAFGSTTGGAISSFGVICGDIGRHYATHQSVEIGATNNINGQRVSMGCPQDTYVYGFKVFYDNSAGVLRRYIKGATALCR